MHFNAVARRREADPATRSHFHSLKWLVCNASCSIINSWSHDLMNSWSHDLMSVKHAARSFLCICFLCKANRLGLNKLLHGRHGRRARPMIRFNDDYYYLFFFLVFLSNIENWFHPSAEIKLSFPRENQINWIAQFLRHTRCFSVLCMWICPAFASNKVIFCLWAWRPWHLSADL